MIVALCGLLLCPSWAQLPPEKLAEFKARFSRGKEKAERGEFTAALKIFEDILAEDPNAKGSLFMAGAVCNGLYQFKKAQEYLDRFLRMEPQHTAALINAVKANQALGRDAQAEAYRSRLFERWKFKQDPVLNLMENYERRRIPLKDGGYLSILEAFNNKSKEAVFVVLRLSKEQRIVSRHEVIRAPDNAGPEMKGKYLWAQPHYKGELMERYEIKKVEDSLPPYLTVQGWVLEEFKDQIAPAE